MPFVHPAPSLRTQSLRNCEGRSSWRSVYGSRFGAKPGKLTELFAGVRTQLQLFEDCDVILLPKPSADDAAEMHEGQVLWGWPHCVQDTNLTQHAIDRKVTVVAWEAMNLWRSDGTFGLHVFHKNNELAGYCSVLSESIPCLRTDRIADR